MASPTAMIGRFFERICGSNSTRSRSREREDDQREMLRGKVVLMKKNCMDLNDSTASLIDSLYELVGKRISLQLISSTSAVPENYLRGRMGRATYLQRWNCTGSAVTARETEFEVTFEWEEGMGVPGALSVVNRHHSEFYLSSLTLEHVPGHGQIHFVCNSWICPVRQTNDERVFFSNKAYLPCHTPDPLRHYRVEELTKLRGDGHGERKTWDRIYDYDVYNDLGNPDKGSEYVRTILGGSEEQPYPRRGRTGRGPTKTDPRCEKRLPFGNLDIYVPRDERFSHVKFSDFLAYGAKAIVQVIAHGGVGIPEIRSFFHMTTKEFDSFQDALRIYEVWTNEPNGGTHDTVSSCISWELLRELGRSDVGFCKFPTPDVIKESQSAWRTDEEFAREMLAGLNPIVIRRLEEFPPASKLDISKYGNHTSTITEGHIEKNMNGLTVDQAIKNKKLFILDYHDTLMPYLSRINSTSTKTYATRTLLFLQEDGTLQPLAIELSLPHPQGESHGAISEVYTPAQGDGVENCVWQLAKAYAGVNDSGYHQLISHWLKTHAVIEPFVIATNRQLSVLHPIYKLLQPHFRDTMYINALARQLLINAGGFLEMTVFPGKFALEMSSVIYKDWNFIEQALPADLLNRGVAVEDPNHPHGLRLLIEDYPYAVDGLEVWSAIETWVTEYCSIYYPEDDLVRNDTELQSWWRELRNEGHGDKKNEPWWPLMQTRANLTKTCTIIIWVASALHAAVNFGQYPYAGYLPNRPTMSRRFMPQPGTEEYDELETNPDLAFFKTITPLKETLYGISLIEILSRYSTDEIYLGQRDTPEWTSDAEALSAFEGFGRRLRDIESRINQRNQDRKWTNRFGPVEMQYTLLYPNTSDVSRQGGLTGKGIPNSVSI